MLVKFNNTMPIKQSILISIYKCQAHEIRFIVTERFVNSNLNCCCCFFGYSHTHTRGALVELLEQLGYGAESRRIA